MQLSTMQLGRCRAFISNRPSKQRKLVNCKAHVQPAVEINRRNTLSALLAGWLVADKAQAVCADLDTAEEGDACRRAELATDEKQNYKGNYKALTGGPDKKLAPNVPVSSLGDEYTLATKDLADKIDAYINIDVYDKKRQGLIKQLKADALTWVSKYARGGSVRAQSARNIYIAADAVLGHLASNGLAPLPATKAKVVQQTINTGLAFLAEGK